MAYASVSQGSILLDCMEIESRLPGFHLLCKQVMDFRDAVTFKLDGVRIAPSVIHGHGLMATRRVDDGTVIFTVDLPDCGEEQGYSPELYDDYVHVVHRDGKVRRSSTLGRRWRGICWRVMRM